MGKSNDKRMCRKILIFIRDQFCIFFVGGVILVDSMQTMNKLRATLLFLGASLAFYWLVREPKKENTFTPPSFEYGWQPTIILDSAMGKIRLQNSQISYANKFSSTPLSAGHNSFQSKTSAIAYHFWHNKISEPPLFARVRQKCPNSDIWFSASQSSVRIIGACSEYTGPKEFKIQLSASEIHQANKVLNTLTHEVRQHEQSS